MSPADQRTWAIATHLSAFLAAVAASEGRDYHYPFTIRFVS